MTSLLSLLASGTILALAVWLLGGLVLRVAGFVLATGGLLSAAATGSLGMAGATILGCVAWLAGHWLYGFRHHYFHSPLARRVFIELLPASFDPTRRWGVPTISRGKGHWS
ncbi:MAG TPA: hypothetical protein VK756_00890 [Solirubrobacteraceae bacterium]|jgi:hypothetical protein|nr:hypothetical protein [Solirubrobacteraceae bacterium]